MILYYIQLIAILVKLLIVLVVLIVCGIPHVLYAKAVQESNSLKEDIDEICEEFERGRY